MILISLNEPSVTLQVYALEQDGSDKLDVSSGTVRVYYVAAGSEVELLVSTPLVQVGATNVWRYEWSPVSFPTGEYIAEFSLVDVYGSSTTIGEDVVVRDLDGLAKQSTLLLVQADLEIVKQVEAGRWKIENNQMTFYDDDNVTPLLVFNLYDQAGLPSMEDVFERREP